MQHSKRPKRDDEPEVTFELDEAPRNTTRSRIGASSAAAIAGAGLVSSAAASELDESLDVFDRLDTPSEQSGDTPVTSFQDLTEAAADPEFPPLDFGIDEPLPTDASGATFGATADVGGGFTLESSAGQEVFRASVDPLEPAEDSLLDYDDNDEDFADDSDDADDLDLF